MKYDVVISAYNGQEYIKDQVESIINQSLSPNKIYIRDDGSNDDTQQVIHKLTKLYDNVVFVEGGSNIGYIKSFQEIALLCFSDIVFFSDQDDVWLSQKAEKIIEVFKSNIKVNCVFTNAYVTDSKLCIEKKLVDNKLTGFVDLETIVLENYCTGATMACRLEFLKEKCIPFNVDIPHDYQIACRASLYNSLYYLQEPLIYYRQHNYNLIGASRKKSIIYAFKRFGLQSHKYRAKNVYIKKRVIDSMDMCVYASSDVTKLVNIQYNIYGLTNLNQVMPLLLASKRISLFRKLVIFYDFVVVLIIAFKKTIKRKK